MFHLWWKLPLLWPNPSGLAFQWEFLGIQRASFILQPEWPPLHPHPRFVWLILFIPASPQASGKDLLRGPVQTDFHWSWGLLAWPQVSGSCSNLCWCPHTTLGLTVWSAGILWARDGEGLLTGCEDPDPHLPAVCSCNCAALRS